MFLVPLIYHPTKMKLERTTYKLAFRMRIELVELETDEPNTKKIKLDLPIGHIKTRSKGKDVKEKDQEEIHQEASE